MGGSSLSAATSQMERRTVSTPVSVASAVDAAKDLVALRLREPGADAAFLPELLHLRHARRMDAAGVPATDLAVAHRADLVGRLRRHWRGAERASPAGPP